MNIHICSEARVLLKNYKQHYKSKHHFNLHMYNNKRFLYAFYFLYCYPVKRNICGPFLVKLEHFWQKVNENLSQK